jgi:predicted CopG family antitoxin
MRRQIQITQELYEDLSKLKKGQSFDAYLKGVVQILERDGTSVKDYEDPIERLVKAQANRVIEVVRGIEKKQEKHLVSILDRLTSEPKREVVEAPAVSAILTDEDRENIEALIKQNEEQGAEIHRLKSENGRLTTQLELEARKPKAGAVRLDEEGMNELLEQIFKLEGAMVLDHISKNTFTINKGDFKVMVDTLKKTIRDYGSNSSQAPIQ